MMMSSTFPTRSNYNIRNGLRDIQKKKENLTRLESALMKRVNELKELCIKEAELTGYLPSDFPLKQREPIPPLPPRRRNNLQQANNNYNIQTNTTTSTNNNRTNNHGNNLINNNNNNNHISHNHNLTSNNLNNHQHQTSNQFYLTRQLQEDVRRKNLTSKHSSYDDQIQQSVKLFEKSSQKLIEATAIAIASNPGLAGRLNNMLPSNRGRY